MRKLITLITGIFMAASFMGCSTGKFNSVDLQKDYDALKAFNVEWPASGQALVDEGGKAIVTNVEENRDLLNAALDQAEALSLLNLLSRSLESNFEEEGIENPTESQKAELTNEIVSTWTQDDRDIVAFYWKSKEAELAQLNDDTEEIIVMIRRFIPAIQQTSDRISGDDSASMLEKGKILYAIGTSLKYANSLLDWSLNCERLIEDVEGTAKRAEETMRANQLIKENN